MGTPLARCVFSVDVEDWFHILDVPASPPYERWDALPSRVEPAFRRMLEIFSDQNVQVTLFFLGWVAERFPQLVREARDAGHEIASHGMRHELVYRIGRERFQQDITRARKVIEDAAGVAVRGYRAPGFSVTADTPWFFEAVAAAGYAYDSSIFPGERGHGGWPGALPVPFRVRTPMGDLVEFPISLGRLLGRDMYFFGGGYLRFFPYALIHGKARQVLREGRPVVFYLHPREIDPGHPRLPMDPKRRFMTYHNLRSTEPKMRRLFNDLPMTTFGAILDEGPGDLPDHRVEGATAVGA
ncbi:MAG: polysaccharide deacetylase family protein [Flavobacteriales bacterium]|nr:polysaccharide deacetylase family protein [Flavobacteriales bacterium]MCB9168464.1 polysaccharide deacetylase family protein [Flavobacteriales bacterium]